jgi:predicted nucleotidyltransferase
MSESAWHKRTREEVFNSFEANTAFNSHSKISRLELFRGDKRRENCLSDVDIVVLDSKKNIIELIEIETNMNPKKLIGIILATHFCDSCVIPVDGLHTKPKKAIIPLKNITLNNPGLTSGES